MKTLYEHIPSGNKVFIINDHLKTVNPITGKFISKAYLVINSLGNKFIVYPNALKKLDSKKLKKGG